MSRPTPARGASLTTVEKKKEGNTKVTGSFSSPKEEEFLLTLAIRVPTSVKEEKKGERDRLSGRASD